MLLKRLLRREMTEADLLRGVEGLIANPPWPPEMRSALTEAKNSDGRTFIEQWRGEIKTLIASIAAEKTWGLQRQSLIGFRVAAMSWLALHAIVKNEPRTALWFSLVNGCGEFAVNPQSRWPLILLKTNEFANMNNAVLHVLGRLAYGVPQRTDDYLSILLELRKHNVEKGVALDRGINEINNIDEKEGERLLSIRNSDIYMTASRQLSAFLREFGERIASDKVDRKDVGDQWERLVNDLNDALRLMMVPGTAFDRQIPVAGD